MTLTQPRVVTEEPVTGKQLLELRRKAGVDAADLAREMRGSAAHLCHVEKGKRPMTARLAKRARSAALKIAERRLENARRFVARIEAAEVAKLQRRMCLECGASGPEQLVDGDGAGRPAGVAS